MVFEVFHFPYNRADHPADWDLVSSIHEDTDVIQALYLNHLVSDLRFQLKNKKTYEDNITYRMDSCRCLQRFYIQ
ncbi:hypothetical protein DW939_08310 [Phocaeicola plebeius]|uniref:Uncharacterized protein n=1 Tax=Phocaeicola plebeius TaxID=310297 RepID=A0A3E4MUB8_9BACT|nr:hypothetical protein DXD04_12315 [Phocaeicola plebeius]RHA34218.1 hypothetical protein DW939_08310 [Phocaeicola plebeius]